MAFNYNEYLRTDKMPTLWCWGCGDGIILKAVIRAIDKLGWNMDDVAIVSGIGCSGRFSSYVNCNTVHTTHGRTVAYATGIKLANPDKHVIVVAGDGDGLAIGGNHTIHGCRRNVDLNFILINNFIYGLTNSQVSPTTPRGMWAVTQQYDNIDPTFDACELAKGSGATFIARELVNDPKKLEKVFVKGFQHRGFNCSLSAPSCTTQNAHPSIPKELGDIRPLSRIKCKSSSVIFFAGSNSLQACRKCNASSKQFRMRSPYVTFC